MPFPSPILAKIPGELWIYLFFGVLWIIGVISERIKKNSQAQPRPTPPAGRVPPAEEPEPEDKPDEDLKELERRFREMIGLDTEPATAEPEPPPLPSRTVPPRPPDLVPARITYDAQPEQRDFARTTSFDADDAFAQLEDIQDIAEVMDQSQEDTSRFKPGVSTLVNLSKIKIPLIRMPVLSQAGSRTQTSHRNLHDRAILRDSLVTNVILGPPKGL